MRLKLAINLSLGCAFYQILRIRQNIQRCPLFHHHKIKKTPRGRPRGRHQHMTLKREFDTASIQRISPGTYIILENQENTIRILHKVSP